MTSSRTRLARLLLTAAVTATAASGLLAAPAHAASRTVQDVAGDVAGLGPGVAAPPGSDLTQVRAKHTAGKLIVTSALTGLDASTTSLLLGAIQTPGGRFETTVDLVPGRRTDRYLSDRRGQVRCQGLRVGVDQAAGTVRVAVPRRCLGNPRWVRVGATVRTEAPGGRYSILDVAGRDGRTDAGDAAVLGRKIGPGFQQP